MGKHILVVGSGTFGVSTALSLRQRGHHVTIFERLPIPAEDSSSNDVTKVIRPDYGDDSLYMGGKMYQALAVEAITRFRKLDLETTQRYGKKSYIECGVAFATREKDMNPYELMSYKALLRSNEYKDALELLDAQSVERLLGKDFAGQFPHGYLNKKAGFADSGLIIAHLNNLAKEAGIRYVVGKSEGLFTGYIVANNRVIGIKTGDGKSHFGDAVLMAAGSWTPSLVPELKGLCEPTAQPVIHFSTSDPRYKSGRFPVWFGDMSQTGYYGFPLTTKNELKFAHHGAGYTSSFHIKTAPSTSPKTPCATAVVTSPNIPREALLKYRSFLQTFFPALNELDVARTRLCWYCDAWDGNFYIDAVPGRHGLFVATGGSGHAFKFTPVIGEVVADVIEEKPNEYRDLFKWRVPTKEQRDTVESQKMEYERGAKCLENMVMADLEDLKASTFKSGKLAAKPREGKGKL
ncbi:FAD dependent oxidoreductase [Chytriomyces sp. MP71]|nr:FAD dependent oxidoreductase [Chytriomyces sp. MP71]